MWKLSSSPCGFGFCPSLISAILLFGCWIHPCLLYRFPTALCVQKCNKPSVCALSSSSASTSALASLPLSGPLVIGTSIWLLMETMFILSLLLAFPKPPEVFVGKTLLGLVPHPCVPPQNPSLAIFNQSVPC